MDSERAIEDAKSVCSDLRALFERPGGPDAVAAGKEPTECKVREVMSPEIRYIYDDESIEDAARNMTQLQVRRLPVLNREKRLVGIVSLGDLALKKKSDAADALRGVSRRT